MRIKHTCVDSLREYAGNFWGREPDQPVFIRELSAALKRTFNSRISSSRAKDTYCHLCQISNKINRVTNLAVYLQVNESSEKLLPGAFACLSDRLYSKLENDCHSLIRTLETIIENDLNRIETTYSPSPPSITPSPSPPFPSNEPKEVYSSMLQNARGVKFENGTIDNMTGVSNVKISFAPPGTIPITTPNWRSAWWLVLAPVVYVLRNSIWK